MVASPASAAPQAHKPPTRCEQARPCSPNLKLTRAWALLHMVPANKCATNPPVEGSLRP